VIIPVIDIMNRQVVRGIGGRRDEYRPIESLLTRSTAPVEVARALVERFSPPALYIADLDAIRGEGFDEKLYRELLSLNVPLWVDAGVRDRDNATRIADAGIDGIVCGSETLRSIPAFGEIINSLGCTRVLFSLDLKHGTPLRSATLTEMIDEIMVLPLKRLIVLDLAAVGEGRGIPTLPLCRQLASTYPQVEIITGGGVHSRADLDAAVAAGVTGVLVASALHDGRIS